MASMTTGIAYDLVGYLREASESEIKTPREGGPMRLVTTGLIEPGQCDWGRRKCRYLKKDYLHPVIDLTGEPLPAYLRDRLRKVARPKVLVAGLSLRVEAFFDEAGIHAGAVSTYSIFDRQDNVDRLRELSDYLNSPEVSRRLALELGATALGGGRITLTKSFLQGLPWPENKRAQPNSSAGPA
jgi:hypothetical protein